MITASRQHGLAYLRRNTAAYIADDPTTISLIPSTRSPDGTGGYDILAAGTPRDPQDFKVIAVPANMDGLVQTEGGSSRNWDYVLLCEYDAEVGLGDSWQDGNVTYTVTGLMHENGYEKRFAVKAFGLEPNYG